MCLAALVIGQGLLLAAPAAKPGTVDAIDAATTGCMHGDDQSTLAMRQCLGRGARELDQRLNQLYESLVKSLSPKDRTLLQDAQRKWLAFREAELKLSWALDPNAGGTLQQLDADSLAYDLLKERARALESYAASSSP